MGCFAGHGASASRDEDSRSLLPIPTGRTPKSPGFAARRIMRPHVPRPFTRAFGAPLSDAERRPQGAPRRLRQSTASRYDESAAVHGRARQASLLRRQATAPPRPAFL